MRISAVIVMLTASFAAWTQDQSTTAPRLIRSQDLRTFVDQSALDRQYSALRTMTLEAVEYSPRGPITSVVGATGIVLPASVLGRKKGDSATDLLPLFRDLLLASGTETLSVRDSFVMYGSERGLELDQSIRGIPVVNGIVSISYNENTKRVSSITAHFIPDKDLPTSAKMSAEQAKEVVRNALEAREGAKVHFDEGASLAYFAEFADPAPPKLVWAMSVVSTDFRDMFYVDSDTGSVVARSPLRMRLTRKVYDMNNSVLANFPQGLPTQLTLTQINSQSHRSSPYNYVKDADDYLRMRIPNSIPEFPSTVNIVVRYGISLGNTWWDVFGGQDYLTFNGALSGNWTHAGLIEDSVVHEFSHGIGARTFPLAGDPSGEWLALHESYADAAATVVDVAKYGSPDVWTWIYADGTFSGGVGIR